MGRTHNPLEWAASSPRAGKKKGTWTRRRVRAKRLEDAAILGQHKAPGHAKAEREARRQSDTQRLLAVMDRVKRQDRERADQYERERRKAHAS